MNISGEYILITGASSGIGRALALSLSQENTVIACGRNTQALDLLSSKNRNIHVFPFDVADSLSVQELKTDLHSLVPHLDRVIMNAGDCKYVSPNEPCSDIYRDMMEVNFFGWLNTVDLTFDLLKKSETRHLIGISSQVVFAPFNYAGAYGASKAAASYFLSCLRLDLRAAEISTTLIYPGFVDTPLTQKNQFSMPFLMPVDKAADRIVKAIAQRKRCYSFPKRLRLLLLLSKLFPSLWESAMAKSNAKNK